MLVYVSLSTGLHVSSCHMAIEPLEKLFLAETIPIYLFRLNSTNSGPPGSYENEWSLLIEGALHV